MYDELKQQICEIGQRIYNRNMVAANDGNISIKVADDRFLCTPTGVSKGFMTPEMISLVDYDGNVVEQGNFKPSSEIKMHLKVYEMKSDVHAVVHAHPQYATAFAICHKPLDMAFLPEAIVSLGTVPLADYGLPSTDEIPRAIEKHVKGHNALLLANHGALTWGCDILEAYHRMEQLEFLASITFKAMALGTPKEFSEFELERLYKLREQIEAGK